MKFDVDETVRSRGRWSKGDAVAFGGIFVVSFVLFLAIALWRRC